MAQHQRKQKTVFTADPGQLTDISELVRSGRYKSTSEFLREAIDEKLQRLQRERLAAQVDRYCSEGYADEGRDLVEAQAFDPDRS
jgi:Arc/MetJ-type ribon-helix-helix transcriptional regulator